MHEKGHTPNNLQSTHTQLYCVANLSSCLEKCPVLAPVKQFYFTQKGLKKNGEKFCFLSSPHSQQYYIITLNISF